MFFLIFVSCKQADNTSAEAQDNTEKMEASAQDTPQFFGEEFDISISQTAEQAYDTYTNLKPGDTIDITFKSKINSVCAMKGCWMRLEMPGETESFVKFKDYGFFVPKDIADSEAIVNGKAFVTQTSVDDLKHFAEDAGKSEDEIAAITEPELTYGFTADGVYLIK